ncbi:1-phosphofructokinase [Coriobacterium glomerans PW2]|uniref:1-phosphofructokinase n=2 Tax=Coriobacterium TaxID=33870 RepID=F2N985_CORGP|nr:1-phosphofructokinase [Coriobacterium glomerans PW2]
MIYTLTPNPAVDLNESCDVVAADTVVRTRDAVFTPNGKGLNVAFTLRRFGVPTRILGFFAGFTGDYIIAGAQRMGVSVIPVKCKGITRVNLFVSVGSGEEYKFVNEGAKIDATAEREMIETILDVADLSCLSISGSMPPGASVDLLDRLVDAARDRDAEVVLDTSSERLAELIRRRPLLIKPNDDELRDVFGLDVRDDATARAALARLHEMGARNVLLTLGAHGAYFSDGSAIWHAVPAFEPMVLSTACAGDGALGSFLSIWFADRSRVEEALALCQAVGANVVESAGLGDFSCVEEYRSRICVRRL